MWKSRMFFKKTKWFLAWVETDIYVFDRFRNRKDENEHLFYTFIRNSCSDEALHIFNLVFNNEDGESIVFIYGGLYFKDEPYTAITSMVWSITYIAAKGESVETIEDLSEYQKRRN